MSTRIIGPLFFAAVIGFATLIGLTLVVMGGGGSILTLPVFVFGLVGPFQYTPVDWRVTLSIFGLGLVGMFSGLFLAEELPSESLSKAFGWFVLVLALVISGLAAAGFRTTTMTS